MGLRDALRRLRGTEERAIDSVPWDVGGPLRPASVSVDQALGLVPVFAAVRLLASQVASLPLQTYRKTGDTRQKISPWPLFVHPSVQGTLYDWLHRCMTSLALRGNAFGYITQRDRDQYPTMIEWLHPDDVRVDDRMPSGPGSYTNPVWYWQGRVIPAEDLLHIPWFTVPGRVLGLSPIGACAATISTGISAQVYTSDWFDSGAVPPGEFRNTAKTVTQTEADIISARLNAAIKRRKPLIYGNDWEYKPIAVAAHEAKFIETMRMNATQIASIYGIPPEMIGGEAGGPLTYNTVESNAAGLEKFTLRPWLTLLEAAFFALMPRPQYVKFNVDSLLRTDLQTRMASYQTGRQIGLYNIDEARAIEDLPPLPNGEGQDYTPLQILTGRAAQPATQTRYLPRHAEYVDAEVIDVQRRELRHTPGGHQHNQLAHGRRAWISGVLNFVAGEVHVGAGNDDEMSVGLGDDHVWMSDRLSDKLAHFLAITGGDYDVGWKRYDFDYEADDRYGVSYFSVTKTGADEYEINLSAGDGSEPPETVALFNVSEREAHALGEEINRMGAARKGDTRAGPFTVVLERDGHYTVALPATSGKPVTLSLTQKEAEALGDAIGQDLIAQLDDHGLRPNPERVVGPDDVLAKRTIKTGTGSITVTVIGGDYGSAHLVFESSQHDWVLRLPDTDAEDIGSALEHSVLFGSDERSLKVKVERRSLGAAALANLRARRQDPADPAAMTIDLPDWDPDEPDPDDDDFIDEGYSRAVTPEGIKGGARLKAYWTTGPGLAKWVASPHPWTALYRQLRKYMPARKAKATAASWFHAVKGYWPGHQAGKNPVGPRGLGADAMADLHLRRADPFDPAGLAFDERHLPGLHDQKTHGRRPGVKAALKKAVKAIAEGADAGPASAKPARRPRIKKAKRLDPATFFDATESPAFRRQVGTAYEGEFAGFRTKVTRVSENAEGLEISGEIVDGDGRAVGDFVREIRPSRGALIAYHANMVLDDAVQGQGFAEAFNAHLIDRYREMGLDRIELEANIDVGGYAWARAGFDFKGPRDAGSILRKLQRAPGAADTPAVRDILDRAERIPFGEPGYPTAYEISQAGRPPGAGKKDTWPGKSAMLGMGVFWEAVKPL